MGTTIRPELSEKNPYWIEKHRYYELKHFCLQYPIWKKAYLALNGLAKRPTDLVLFSSQQHLGDPTAKCAEARIATCETGSRRNRCGTWKLYFTGCYKWHLLRLFES